MTSSAIDLESCLAVASDAARQAGALLRQHYGEEPQVNELKQYDIKLDLDVRCQDLITSELLGAFPDHAIYGEEGMAGNQASEFQWIVDPIDGTVNYYYGIPHFCVSIALRRAGTVVLGVIYDPMMDELFAACDGREPSCNGRRISVSQRAALAEAVITVGFSKSRESLEVGFKRFHDLAFKVRKTRMLGSAALALAYIACGRLDAYVEEIINLWDIAAGQFLVERAGGSISLFAKDSIGEKFSMCAHNGRLPLDHIIAEMGAQAAVLQAETPSV